MFLVCNADFNCVTTKMSLFIFFPFKKHFDSHSVSFSITEEVLYFKIDVTNVCRPMCRLHGTVCRACSSPYVKQDAESCFRQSKKLRLYH